MSIKIWKDKSGNKITLKEFKNRFKEGISLITPIQKIENEVRANFTMLIGYIVGFVALIIKFNLIPNKVLSVALIIIFFGAAWSNGIKWLALRQQLKIMKSVDNNAIDLDSILNNLELVEEEKVMTVNGEVGKGMSTMGINMEKYTDDLEGEKDD